MVSKVPQVSVIPMKLSVQPSLPYIIYTLILHAYDYRTFTMNDRNCQAALAVPGAPITAHQDLHISAMRRVKYMVTGESDGSMCF